MGSNICMNGLCGATMSSEWKRGWAMKSGGFANLCYDCGIAYDNVAFCEKFHLNEPGWRECKFCEKPIHCGCIASKYLHGYLDFGGIACFTCLRDKANHSLRPLQSSSDDIQNDFGLVTPINGGPSAAVESQISGVNGDKGKYQLFLPTPSSNKDPTFSIGQVKGGSKVPSSGEVGTGFSSTEARSVFQDAAQKSISSSTCAKPDNTRPTLLAQAPLTFSLGGQQGTKNSGMSGSGIGVTESNEPVKVPPFKQIQENGHILPKPSKRGSGSNAESPQANKVTPQQTLVVRPPADPRGRNLLLPRYWPKISDQELDQISLDLKSNIVPLFEKILSASDAGRIGRLVLPKACAEIYFPPLSNSEGLPIRAQDIKGKEWTFQFRFWPNNNSRMYVLEGVTPCIQTMELQAGDTVIFSRTDPGNKFVIGCRKATNSVDTQEAEVSRLPNGLSGETSHTGVNEATPRKKEYEGKNGHSKKKRSRNIGSKSKRLLMHGEDAMKLRVTWKEAQELFRPPPIAKPNVVMIENCEIEEHDESPVFGKRTIFATQASGEQEQWGQCDNCFKWRRLPLDIFLPSRWICSDNAWDPKRCSCSAPDELKNSREFERVFGVRKGFKRRKRTTEKKIAREQEEPTGLDALALVAVSGDLEEPSLGATATTTRHPRHRPGCTCIVCIQPPSGKGNHEPTCICIACLTVKRRFRTLMLRKKKRHMGSEAEIISQAQEDVADVGSTEDVEMEIVGETGKGNELDLNCDPNREEEVMMGVEASLPLEGHNGGENGVESMVPCVLSRAVCETDEYPPDNACFLPMDEADDGSKGDGK